MRQYGYRPLKPAKISVNNDFKDKRHSQRPTATGGASHYILVANDIDKYRKWEPSAFQVASQCLDRKVWGFGFQSNHRRTLKIADSVLIYIAGVREHRQSFIGVAEIADQVKEKRMSISTSYWNYSVTLRKVRQFKTPIPIRTLIGRLKLISPHARKKWGCYFQGGVVKLKKQDFELILKSTQTDARLEHTT